MNPNLLIEAILRQTTVLIAQLATSGGGGAQLVGTADQVLADLVSELQGQGVATGARPPTPLSDEEAARAANFVWVTICRHEPVSREVLLQSLPLETADLDTALSRLLGEGRVRRTGEGAQLFEASTALIEQNNLTGWEAAVFDHYQAMVTAICTRLQLAPEHPHRSAVGGSTFRFEVWPDHPMRDEVIGFLDRVRSQGSELRERLAEYNQGKEPGGEESERVLAYVGQAIVTTQRESRADSA